MSFEDFCREFSHLYVLRLYSDATGEQWARQQIDGALTAATSGGCLNFGTWTKNPQFQLSCVENAKVFVSIVVKDPRSASGPGDYEAIGFFVIKKEKLDDYRVTVLKGQQQIAASVTYKTQRESSFEFSAVKGVTYVIVPSYFDAGVTGEFCLRVFSQQAMSPIKALTEEQTSAGVSGQWIKGVSSGGCPNYATWRSNPQFLLEVTAPKTQLTIALEQAQLADLPAIGLYVFKTRPSEVKFPSLDAQDKVASTSFSPAPQGTSPHILQVLPSDLSFLSSLHYPRDDSRGVSHHGINFPAKLREQVHCQGHWRRRKAEPDPSSVAHFYFEG